MLQQMHELCADAAPTRIRFARMSGPRGPNTVPEYHCESWSELPTPHGEWDEMTSTGGLFRGWQEASAHAQWARHSRIYIAESWRCGALPCQFPFWWGETDVLKAMVGSRLYGNPRRLFILEADVSRILWLPAQVVYDPISVNVIEELFPE